LVAYTHKAKASGDCIFGKGAGEKRARQKRKTKKKNKINT
jgi:hypothetical protein